MVASRNQHIFSPQNKYKTGKKFKQNSVRNLEIDQRQREIEVHLFVKTARDLDENIRV